MDQDLFELAPSKIIDFAQQSEIGRHFLRDSGGDDLRQFQRCRAGERAVQRRERSGEPSEGHRTVDVVGDGRAIGRAEFGVGRGLNQDADVEARRPVDACEFQSAIRGRRR